LDTTGIPVLDESLSPYFYQLPAGFNYRKNGSEFNSRQAVLSAMMKVIELAPSQLKPYENNPRQNDDAVGVVIRSIKEFGFRQPIVVDQDYVIIVGHTRYKAALKMGLKMVPVVIIDDLDPMKVKAYRLADNRTHELSNWDFPLLKDELESLDTGEIDLEMTGWLQSEIEELMTKYGDEFEPVSEDEQGRLDEKSPVTCPKCGHEFTP